MVILIYKIGISDEESNNYNTNSQVKGDAIYETSGSIDGSYSWNEDYSYFPNTSWAFFPRGGMHSSGTIAGVFFFSSSKGDGGSSHSFCPALAF